MDLVGIVRCTIVIAIIIVVALVRENRRLKDLRVPAPPEQSRRRTSTRRSHDVEKAATVIRPRNVERPPSPTSQGRSANWRAQRLELGIPLITDASLARTELTREVPRQRLDGAHRETFLRYLKSEIGTVNQDRAAPALTNLQRRLASSGAGPEYEDPYIALAYLVLYQINHCVMAFRAYDALFADTDVPASIYVCDVGAGAMSGRIGLNMALERRNAHPRVLYCAVERSEAR